MESPAIGAPAWAAGAMGCRGPPWRESWGIKEIPTFAKQKSYVTLGLVGGWATPLKNMSSSVGSMTFPIVWKVIKAMFQTTNQKHFAPRKSGWRRCSAGEDGDVGQTKIWKHLLHKVVLWKSLWLVYWRSAGQFPEFRQHCTTFPDHFLKYCRCSIPSGKVLHNELENHHAIICY